MFNGALNGTVRMRPFNPDNQVDDDSHMPLLMANIPHIILKILTYESET
jgi:hypothetical protein